ncbi:MAG TPA: 3-oxoacyl-[acyl-carrier-protein] synthase III C-terminal domain-containing protein [Trebonia sp.]|jgi:alkylresorcinol/alkylpyrone synthase
MTRIRAVLSAFPGQRHPQPDLIRAFADLTGLSPARRGLLDRLHRNDGVDTRHVALPLPDYDGLRGITARNDRYLEAALDVGEQALRGALDAAGLTGGDVDLLIVTSVTGVAVPSLDARLIPRLGLRPDVKRLPVFGLGCVAGAAGLGRLHDYLLGWPAHTAALLAVELCTLNWPVSDISTADLVVSALFGDGAAALVASGDGAGGGQAGRAGRAIRRQPRVIASRSEVYPDSDDTLGWRLGADGFRIVLTAELADVVERRLSGSVTAFLAAHGLTVDDIKSWVCHPGGPKVLDAVQKSLKLPGAAMEISRRSLAEAGNMSSVSVLHILEQVIDTAPPPPGSPGLMIGLGPGVSAELVLLRW